MALYKPVHRQQPDGPWHDRYGSGDPLLCAAKPGERRAPAYLAVNPLGKVPAIRYRGAIMTEQVAITIHLADLFPRTGLAPALNDPLRGPYLRWIAYYGSSFEPALIDRFMRRDPAPIGQSPYADYETMLGAVEAQLAGGPYLFGDRLTAADILWGAALSWTMTFGLVPRSEVFERFAERITSRPAFRLVDAADAEMAAVHAAAVGEPVGA
ncbi:glutathione S-transferase family protein [Sphingomonas colocasiae]|uniref:Glutathione S-transferase C-terminal domain-containing protein n=1 Tax=Sphingomonas colocasiae TaxID=1848973 RepID=A0ABS7PQV6_9SPHN|nr:glutathione S-transferase C-terminal domain-containing protein [Sphingomonas colocasiae]MBY8823717.1 glutathione S-transferase C-terminal domain-containing protein [Sphingomonas colocasiae]